MANDYHNDWDQGEDLAGRYQSGGDITNLPDNDDFVLGYFIGEDVRYHGVWGRELHFGGPGVAPTLCDGEGCQKCKGGDRPNLKYWFSFFCTEKQIGNEHTTPNEVIVLELSARGFRNILACRKEYGGTLKAWRFRVKRQGKKGSTQTTFLCLPTIPSAQAEPAEQAALAEAKSINLKELADRLAAGRQGDDDGTDFNPSQYESADDLVDAATAGKLAAELGPLGREGAIALLGRFGATNCATIKKSAVEAISAAIAAALKPVAPVAPASDDPFATS